MSNKKQEKKRKKKKEKMERESLEIGFPIGSYPEESPNPPSQGLTRNQTHKRESMGFTYSESTG